MGKVLEFKKADSPKSPKTDRCDCGWALPLHLKCSASQQVLIKMTFSCPSCSKGYSVSWNREAVE